MDTPVVHWSARLGQARSVLVHLVSLMQPNKPDRPNRPNEQDWLADVFSILLERLVRAIAERRGLGLLALAQGNLFLLRHPEMFLGS